MIDDSKTPGILLVLGTVGAVGVGVWLLGRRPNASSSFNALSFLELEALKKFQADSNFEPPDDPAWNTAVGRLRYQGFLRPKLTHAEYEALKKVPDPDFEFPADPRWNKALKGLREKRLIVKDETGNIGPTSEGKQFLAGPPPSFRQDPLGFRELLGLQPREMLEITPLGSGKLAQLEEDKQRQMAEELAKKQLWMREESPPTQRSAALAEQDRQARAAKLKQMLAELEPKP